MPDEQSRPAARPAGAAGRRASAALQRHLRARRVTVSEDAEAGGQFWTRIYGRRRGFPQVIHSSKRFAGPTGLEEYIGRGFGIALRVEVEDEALHFLSDHYFVKLGGGAFASRAGCRPARSP